MKTSTFIDRSKWPHGPWDNEPDRVEWSDKVTGLSCMAKRHEDMGHWCGYVGVVEGHPLFEVDYQDDRINFGVHGGITFADHWDDNELVWWFGFDCNHLWSSSPYRPNKGKYHTLALVEAECASLAKQLMENCTF